MSENTSLEVRDIEKGELNASVDSYVENRNELLERVPDLIDWNMFQRRCVPELVEVLQMQHKRLQKRGVTIRTQQKDIFKDGKKGKIRIIQTENHYQDGRYPLSVLQKKRKRIREYYHEQKRLSKFKDKAWFTYFFRQEPGEGKKLSSEDMAFKVFGNYTRDSEYLAEPYTQQGKNELVVISLTFWVVTSALRRDAINFLGLLLSMLLSGWPEKILVISSIVGAVLPECLFKVFLIKSFLSWRRGYKSHKVLQTIRLQYPMFCMEKFVSMADSRLKRIFYADSMVDIGDFVSCDLTEFLKDYANVVDCETLDFRFMGVSQDENYEYIDVRQKVLLTGDLGNRMKRKKRTVKIRFMRTKDSIMYTDFYRDWYIGQLATGIEKYGNETE